MASDNKAKPDADKVSAEGKQANQAEDNQQAQSDTEMEPIDETLAKEIARLKADLDKAQAAAKENWEATLRATADLENTRKRLERDVENAHKFAVERFVSELLPVIDSLEMGVAAANMEGADLASVREGTELTLKKFIDTTGKFGIEAVNPEGQEFNPEFHQAVSMLESPEHKPNSVINVMQKGYLLKGRLIRPAMVVVAKAPAGNVDTGEKDEKLGGKIDEKA